MLYDPKWEVGVKHLEDWQVGLLAAADLIETEGHCVGKLHVDGVGYCFFGALGVVFYNHPGEVWTKAVDALKKVIGSESVTGWNDTHHKAEVVMALREAAK